MAIAAVGGTTKTSAVNVTSLAITYSPTAGNQVLIVLCTKSNLTGLTLVDNLSNSYTPTTTSGTAAVWNIKAPTGVTGFTASWSSSQTGVMALEEYSGAAGSYLIPSSVQTNPSTAASNTILLPAGGDFAVALGVAGSAVTITSGTQRQVTGAVNGDNAFIVDNTNASPTNVTITETGATGFIVWFLFIVGGLGRVRVDQDLVLVLKSPTSSKARVDQDLVLVLSAPTSSNARVSQDVLLVLTQNNLLRKLHPHHPLVAWRKKPKLKSRFGFLQNAALLAATPVYPPNSPFPVLLAPRTHKRGQRPVLHPQFRRILAPAAAVTAQPWAWVFTS